MERKLIFVLCVCLAITEFSKGREIFRKGINQNEVLSNDDIFPDGISKIEQEEDTKAAPCVEDDVVHDQYGRQCQCENGKQKCCRIRKEFTSMTNEERVRYIETVLTASTDPAYKIEYEDLLLLHRTLFCEDIHKPDIFLPWHRWFVLQYEDLLRRVNCNVTIPYWDWSAVAADPWSSSMWNSGNDSFGGDGDPNADDCVKDGPFRDPLWSYPSGKERTCLKRSFQENRYEDHEGEPIPIVPGTEVIDDIMELEASNMTEFEERLRWAHDSVHCAFGNTSTMCNTVAAYAPEFFLHHSFIDKLWWDWQKKGEEYMYNKFFVDQTEKMTFTGYYPREFLNLREMPSVAGDECAAYEEKIVLNVQATWQTGFLPLPPISISAIKLFGAKISDVIRIRQDLERRIAARRARSQIKTSP